MNWYSIFYWLTIADKVIIISGILSVILGIYTIAAFIAALGGFDSPFNEWEKGSKRVFFWLMPLFFFFLLLWTFTPSKKDCLLIVAGGAVGNFVTSDTAAQQIPSDITKFLHQSLKTQIEDLSESAKSEVKQQLDVPQDPKDELLDKVKDLSKEEIIKYLKTDSTHLKK